MLKITEVFSIAGARVILLFQKVKEFMMSFTHKGRTYSAETTDTSI